LIRSLGKAIAVVAAVIATTVGIGIAALAFAWGAFGGFKDAVSLLIGGLAIAIAVTMAGYNGEANERRFGLAVGLGLGIPFALALVALVVLGLVG
jgi:hypothetical protein